MPTRSAIAQSFLAAALMASSLAAGQGTPSKTSDESALEGDWRGDSICVATGTACRDEKVVYHLARISGKPGYISVNADKIVNGSPI